MNLAQPVARIFTLFGLTVNQHIFDSQALNQTLIQRHTMRLFFVLIVGSINGLPYPKFEWEEVRILLSCILCSICTFLRTDARSLIG